MYNKELLVLTRYSSQISHTFTKMGIFDYALHLPDFWEQMPVYYSCSFWGKSLCDRNFAATNTQLNPNTSMVTRALMIRETTEDVPQEVIELGYEGWRTRTLLLGVSITFFP
ncbi:hypothetical protein BZZ01_06415 [Nostocales cyanobacterium HT-58-2]|nr:hypothetical protein BZZ01_06415 [Nostocales cyanobacterium HT-58-2]